MNVAEKLAREIRRVAGLRAKMDRPEAWSDPEMDVANLVVDAALDAACKAIGDGDPVAMEAAGQGLERFTL